MEAAKTRRIVLYRHSARGLRALHRRFEALEAEAPRPPAPQARPGSWALLIAALAPALAAVWLTPWFVTQDGPAHLYNAGLLLDSLLGRLGSAQSSIYEATWRPVPNWGGHGLLMGLLAIFPAWVADRLMTTLTLGVVPAAALWARGQVWGKRGQPTAAIGLALLGISLPWLLGFGAFLIGLALGMVTLGLAWRWRDRMDGRRALAIAALLAAGYLGHLVALALTTGGLIVLAASAGGPRHQQRRRIGWIGAALAVLVPLALVYRSVASGSGQFAPTWDHLTSWTDPTAWARQLGWADPVTIGRRTLPPLVDAAPSAAWIALAPVGWFAVGLAASAWGARTASGRSWVLVGSAGLLGALVGPDSFGADHGHYLPQRLALFGFLALIVGLDLGGPRARWVAAAFGAALALQWANVWGYALESSTRVGPVMAARTALGRDQRIGTLLVGVHGRYRANPLLHADCGLGVGTGHVVWSNYETRHYYFPIRVRPGVPAPSAAEFEEAAIRDGAADADARADRWARLLDAHARSIDALICYGRDPRLDRVTARHFDARPRFESGPIRVLRRRSIAGAAPGPL